MVSDKGATPRSASSPIAKAPARLIKTKSICWPGWIVNSKRFQNKLLLARNRWTAGTTSWVWESPKSRTRVGASSIRAKICRCPTSLASVRLSVS